MSDQHSQDIYVKVKDMAGNEFVCPLKELRDARKISDDELENCFEGDVVGRYAGLLNIVEPES
jgi:hypothetical protein